MQAFPLQNKKLQRMVLPFMTIGMCEMMNASQTYSMDSFNVFNSKNRGGVYRNSKADLQQTPQISTSYPYLGDMVGAGIFDGYTGVSVSRFVSQYLARALSLHTIVPAQLRELRREFPEDPVLDIIMASTHRRRTLNAPPSTAANSQQQQQQLQSLITDWDMQQYAVLTDSAFFRACEDQRRREGNKEISDARESGCRGVWFSAVVAPSALELQRRLSLETEKSAKGVAPPPLKTLESSAQVQERERANMANIMAHNPFCLDVVVSNVGDSRAFGIARNPHTEAAKSHLDPTRERMVVLSIDHTTQRTLEYRRIHHAGGTVDAECGGIIDGNPFYNVSRSFGHWSMKSNRMLSPMRQKMIALPNCVSWEMLQGDVLVLLNHAACETRHQDDTSLDEVAKVITRQLDCGLSPEEAAAAVCDFAVRFGASHCLQVVVAVATVPNDDSPNSSHLSAGDALPSAVEVPDYKEWVMPGPLYVEACRHLPEYQQALQLDCERCEVTLSELLKLRWERIRNLVEQRNTLPLMSVYGKECGALQQIMEEEALFFDTPALRASSQSPLAMAEFAKLARDLVKPQTRRER